MNTYIHTEAQTQTLKVLTVTLMLLGAGAALAQPIQTLPNGSGGYNTYSPNGA